MTADWMDRTAADDMRDEWRDARDRPLRQHRSHPITCFCPECIAEEIVAMGLGGRS